jgi:hypothetical protein
VDIHSVLILFIAIAMPACASSAAESTLRADRDSGECYKPDCRPVFNINEELKLYRGGHIFNSAIAEENIEDCFIPL